jgi:elongation factor 3
VVSCVVQNGVGKTTLMRSIATGCLEGLPEGLKTVYVESNPASDLETPVAAYVCADATLPAGTTEETVRRVLGEMGFTPELQAAPLCSLSGGWRMKLALAQAMLSGPDMLLLDEPTNHLDVNAVAWLTEWLQVRGR